jgi:NAD(P)-dependent dehydrogenase (short-subunit alcohol dehydrogenase family)
MRPPAGNLWLDTFFARKSTDRVTDQDLSGKQIVFTGGTDGMGRVAVQRFAEMGADICLIGRNPVKTKHVVDEVNAAGSGKISFVQCDLGSLDDVRNAAGTVLSLFDRIDLLVNCAGANIPERRLSSEGYEMNFVVNYLAPFLFTELLLERVKASPSSRIVALTSATQQFGRLNFDNLQLETGWSLGASYSQAKVCVIMHSRDLARRLEGSGTSIACMNPGYIKSNLVSNAKGIEAVFTNLFGSLAAPTWVGGERIVAVALEKRFRETQGNYIYEDTFLEPNPTTLDDELVAKLMKISREMVSLQ